MQERRSPGIPFTCVMRLRCIAVSVGDHMYISTPVWNSYTCTLMHPIFAHLRIFVLHVCTFVRFERTRKGEHSMIKIGVETFIDITIFLFTRHRFSSVGYTVLLTKCVKNICRQRANFCTSSKSDGTAQIRKSNSAPLIASSVMSIFRLIGPRE